MSRRGPVRAVVRAVSVLAVVAVVALFSAALLAPTPNVETRALTLPRSPTQPALALPKAGSSAVASVGEAPESAGASKALPLAASAKLIIVLVALDAHPLTAGHTGPLVPVTADDAAYSRSDLVLDQRSVPLHVGDVWTESDVVSATLIASSNDSAVMLAAWAFGSQAAYVAAATTWLATQHLASIRVTDATGLDPGNVGTAADVTRLAMLAMRSPVVASMLTESSTVTASGYRVDNGIALAGEPDITIMSRSYTDAAGVCVVFAWHRWIDGVDVRLVGTLLNEPDWTTLGRDLRAFRRSATHLRVRRIAADTPVLALRAPWGAATTARTETALSAFSLQSAASSAAITPPVVSTAPAGTRAGSLAFVVPSGERQVPLVLDGALRGPDAAWRLLHPFQLLPEFIDAVRGLFTEHRS